MRLPLFGGVDTKTDCQIEVSAFELAFLNKKCVCAFEKKLALQFQDAEVKALTILQQEKSVQLLIVKELDVL